MKLVTPDPIFGSELGWSDQTIRRQWLCRDGVAIFTDRRLLEVERKGSKLHATFDNALTDDLEIGAFGWSVPWIRFADTYEISGDRYGDVPR